MGIGHAKARATEQVGTLEKGSEETIHWNTSGRFPHGNAKVDRECGTLPQVKKRHKSMRQKTTRKQCKETNEERIEMASRRRGDVKAKPNSYGRTRDRHATALAATRRTRKKPDMNTAALEPNGHIGAMKPEGRSESHHT